MSLLLVLLISACGDDPAAPTPLSSAGADESKARTQIEAAAVSGNSIDLRWPLFLGSSSTYYIKRLEDGHFKRVASGKGLKQYTDKQLKPETTYQYLVKACRKANECATTAVLKVTTRKGSAIADEDKRSSQLTQRGGVPAFPGAQGYGAESVGGRGGKVYVVTSLDDDKNNPRPGTLRHALMQTHPRTIVFRVAGYIDLKSDLILRKENSYVTVAGQTAPGDGITIRGVLQLRGTENAVFRYLRLRGKGVPHNFIIMAGRNIILDHISASYATNDNINAFYSSTSKGGGNEIRNLTLSRSIVGPGIGGHATAGGWRGKHDWVNGSLRRDHEALTNVDMHHNLFVHNSHRTPRTIAGGAKIVNNVVYNSRTKLMESRGAAIVDYVGNYLKKGPMSAGGADRYIVHETYKPCPTCTKQKHGYPVGSIYVDGNVGAPDFATPPSNPWDLLFTPQGERLSTDYRRSRPLGDGPYAIEVQSASAAYNSVLADVGPHQRLDCEGNWVESQDAIDARLISDTRNGRGPSSVFQSISAAGGYPALRSGSACADQDGDGMPDAYEKKYGLNPADASDANDDNNGNGFTNLEEYLAGRRP